MSKKKLFNIDKNDLMFNNKVLFALLIPIVIEQLSIHLWEWLIL